MPRDSSGNYSLPVGNPVVTGTLIESDWANTTMDDIAASLTNSLDRYGQGGMEAQLKLINGDASTPALSFTSNTQVGLYYDGTDVKYSNGALDEAIIGEAPDDTVVYGRGNKQWKPLDSGGYTPLPIGSIVQFSATAASLPSGWLECDGRAVSRSTYSALSDLYAAIPGNAYPYGDGDGTTTFNLPDFRGRVPVGVGDSPDVGGGPDRVLSEKGGEHQHQLTVDELAAHNHPVKGQAATNVASGTTTVWGINPDTTTSNAGGNGFHNTMQPYLVVTFAVKALVDTIEGGPAVVNGHVIQDESATYTQRANLRFEGAGVTVSDDSVGDASVVTIPGGGVGASGTINKVAAEGTTISTDRSEINFIEGANVTILVADDAGNDQADVTISATPGAPTPSVLKLPIGWVIGGPITAAMDTGGTFIPVDAGGQATVLDSATFVLKAGTCSVQIYLDGAPIGGLANVSDAPASLTGLAAAVSDNDFLTLVVTTADANAELLSFTAQMEHTI